MTNVDNARKISLDTWPSIDRDSWKEIAKIRRFQFSRLKLIKIYFLFYFIFFFKTDSEPLKISKIVSNSPRTLNLKNCHFWEITIRHKKREKKWLLFVFTKQRNTKNGDYGLTGPITSLELAYICRKQEDMSELVFDVCILKFCVSWLAARLFRSFWSC